MSERVDAIMLGGLASGRQLSVRSSVDTIQAEDGTVYDRAERLDRFFYRTAVYVVGGNAVQVRGITFIVDDRVAARQHNAEKQARDDINRKRKRDHREYPALSPVVWDRRENGSGTELADPYSQGTVRAVRVPPVPPLQKQFTTHRAVILHAAWLVQAYAH